MKLIIIIPVHNEALYLEQMLTSLVKQTLRPHRVILVNDNSTDQSQEIIDQFTKNYPFIQSVYNTSKEEHEPGSKVVTAFYKALDAQGDNFDLIGKFDADILLPPEYFERLIPLFETHSQLGLAGGNLYIQQGDHWMYEAISEKTKVRGPIKLYRKECFEQIGGLKKSIGWDTVDELLAQYHGWEIKTDPSLHVKHLKPTGTTYSKASKYKQGEAFKKMRYGFLLTLIAAAKLALKKKNLPFFFNTLLGFVLAKRDYIVSKKEGEFIRALRWRNIKKKLF